MATRSDHTIRALTEPESTQNRLLEAAIQAFAANGFYGTTTRDIANSAGLSPAGVYVHYASKEELLFTISKTGHSLLVAELACAVKRATNPTDQLVELARALALWHAEGHTRARVNNYELAALTPEHHAVIIRLRRRITATVQAVVEAGQEDGSFDVDDVVMTTRALLSLSVDISRWYPEARHVTPEQIADLHAELALRMVKAGEATRTGTRQRKKRNPRSKS